MWVCRVRSLVSAALLTLLPMLSTVATAKDLLKPYILASEGTQTLAAAIDETRSKLTKGGFQVIGEYTPYDEATILVATTPDLKRMVVNDSNLIYLLGWRVGITQAGGKIQVTYANPEYFAAAYKVKSDLAPLAAKLEATLGKIEPFGANGLTKEQLGKYNYSFGMEYFEDAMLLATYNSYDEARAKVQAALGEKDGGSSKVYEIDIPEKELSVIGVAMSDGMSGDQAIMKTIDVSPIRHTAHLPHEMVIIGNQVKALHPRFRIALSFPDLKMVGDHGFMKLMKTPEAIEKALTLAAGATWDRAPPRSFLDY